MRKAASFKAIATRDLVLTRPDGFEIPIYVAIGAPYRPAKMEGTEHLAGCEVLTYDDPDLATEVCGRDEMEALSVALNFLELYLINVVEKTSGKLRNADGSPVDPLGSIFLKESRAIVAKKVGKT